MSRKRIRPIVWGAFLVAGILATIFHSCSRAKAEGWDPGSGEPWQPPDWAESTFEPVEYTAPPVPTPLPEDSEAPSKDPTQWRGSSTQPPGVSTPVPTEEPLDMAAPDLAYKFKAYFDIGSYSWSSSSPNRVYLTSYRGGVSGRYGDLTPWPIFTDSISTTIISTAGNFKNYYETQYSDVTMNTLSLRYNGVYTSMYLMPRGTIDNTYTMKISLLWLSSLLDLNYPSNANDQAIYDAVQPDDLAYCPVHVFCVITTSSGRSYDYETTFFVSDLIVGVSIPISTDQFLDGDTLAGVSINLAFNWPPQDNSVIQQFNDYYAANGITPSYYPTFNFVSASKLKVKVILDEPKEVSKNFIQKFFGSLFVPDQDRITSIINSVVPDTTSGGGSFVLSIRNTLYDLFTTQSRSPVTITLPAIDIPMGSSTIHLFDGYIFDLQDFYYGPHGAQGERPPFATLMSGVRFMTSVLIFSAFFGSLWEIFIEVFGLNKWSGVYDRKESEIEEEST